MIKTKTIKLDKVICIDDSDKPNEIQTNNWIKKNEEYTIMGLFYNPIQGLQLFTLKEISTGTPEYKGYRTDRFATPEGYKLSQKSDIDKIVEEFIKEEAYELIEV